ncbi:MAG: phosphoribosylamine--glycine ligase [Candidatus Fimenecus sp.]
MRILVVGSGGREHAIIKKISENKSIEKIFCTPGNAGIADFAECVDISATDIKGICNFAIKNKIDFAVVSPDDPLIDGMVDELEALGIKCFGPNKKAAIIEGSKAFSKELMKKYNIPTAKYESFNFAEDAINYILSQNKYPIVIKASGPALGKGVIIAENKKEAITAIKELMEEKKFGSSGNTVVIEEFLTGPEVSILAFTDGNSIVPMISSMDHKKAKDKDKGLNTGGMGTIAPNPYYTAEIAEICMNKIFIPTIKAMTAEGRKFKGCLFFGLMLTSDGPKVIEYNCRFGDPETQVVLPLLKTDLFEIFKAVREETLDKIKIEFIDKSAACVILASGGYPENYEKGKEIYFNNINNSNDIFIFHAGTKKTSDKIVTNGGRVLGLTAIQNTLKEAIDTAYTNIRKINFENSYMRNDIGKKALEALNGDSNGK